MRAATVAMGMTTLLLGSGCCTAANPCYLIGDPGAWPYFCCGIGMLRDPAAAASSSAPEIPPAEPRGAHDQAR